MYQARDLIMTFINSPTTHQNISNQGRAMDNGNCQQTYKLKRLREAKRHTRTCSSLVVEILHTRKRKRDACVRFIFFSFLLFQGMKGK